MFHTLWQAFVLGLFVHRINMNGAGQNLMVTDDYGNLVIVSKAQADVTSRTWGF